MQDYEPVSYNYSWFHFIFSLASMYIAMLMTGALSLRRHVMFCHCSSGSPA
jgi:Serine incorporator (Serinc)